MSSFKWNPGARQAIQRACADALTETAHDIVDDVERRQVVPHAEAASLPGHEAGALARSVEVEPAKSTRARITWTFTGAARAYFHPEWDFSQSVHGNARGAWMEDYINGGRTPWLRERYRVHLGRQGAIG